MPDRSAEGQHWTYRIRNGDVVASRTAAAYDEPDDGDDVASHRLLDAVRVATVVLGLGLSLFTSDISEAARLWAPMMAAVAVTVAWGHDLHVGRIRLPAWVLDLVAVMIARSSVDIEVVGEPLFALLLAPILAGFTGGLAGIAATAMAVVATYAAVPPISNDSPVRATAVSVLILTALAVVGHLVNRFDQRQRAARRDAVDTARRHQAVLSAVLRADHRGVVVRNPDGIAVEINERAAEMLRLRSPRARETFVTRSYSDTKLIDETGRRITTDELAGAVARRTGDVVGEQIVSPDAGRTWLAISSTPVDAPDGRWVVNQIRDITEERRTLVRLQKEAAADPLTGIGNRRLLDWALRDADPDEGVAIVALDLDDFKLVNDTFGHDAGDQVLVQLARRLESAVRPDDIVVRLGGDEFVAMLRDIDAPTAADVVARIRGALDGPVAIGEGAIGVAASVGWATGRARHATDLLRQADVAMYSRKRRRGGADVRLHHLS